MIVLVTLMAFIIQSTNAFTVKKTAKSASNEASTEQVTTQHSTYQPTAHQTPPIKTKLVSEPSVSIEPLGTIHSFISQISLDEETWVDRGSIDVVFATAGNNRATVSFTPDTLNLTESQLSSLSQVVVNNGLYRIRVKPADDSSADWIVSSTRACALVASAYHDQLTMHFDIYGNLVTVNLRTPILTCNNEKVSTSKPASIRSKGAVSLGRSGALPHNVRVKLESSEVPFNAEAEAAKKEEEQTFWQKYWMYIVPFGVFVLVQLVMAPPEAKAGAPAAR